MKLTAKQAFVLENIERVVQLRRKVSPRPRYDLNGIEVNDQIRTLVIHDFVTKNAAGDLYRTRKKA